MDDMHAPATHEFRSRQCHLFNCAAAAMSRAFAQLVPRLRLGMNFLEALLRHGWLLAEKRAQQVSKRKLSFPDVRCEAELRNERKVEHGAQRRPSSPRPRGTSGRGV